MFSSCMNTFHQINVLLFFFLLVKGEHQGTCLSAVPSDPICQTQFLKQMYSKIYLAPTMCGTLFYVVDVGLTQSPQQPYKIDTVLF